MVEQGVSAAAKPTGASRWRRALPFAVLLLAMAAVFASGLHQHVSFETLRTHRAALAAWVADNRVLGMLTYVLGYAALTALSLPFGFLATLVGGFLFGWIFGTLLTVVGATTGAVAVFLAARGAFGDVLRGRADGFLGKLEAGFRRDAFNYLLFLRLVPAFPFWLVNIAPAFLGVRLRTYALATFLGIIPGTAVFCSVGAGLGAVFDRGEAPSPKLVFEPHVLLPLLALAALSLMPVLYARWKARGGAPASRGDAPSGRGGAPTGRGAAPEGRGGAP
ncbi:MAG: TVP38/TMEM64 family protein [Rhodospirillales bacterium]|nr:MAG: TVP38/TMEM64 family protein [Rhodospirillales bacterium]